MRICTRFHTSKRWFSRLISEKSTVAICTIGASAVGDDKHSNNMKTEQLSHDPKLISFNPFIRNGHLDTDNPCTRNLYQTMNAN